MFFDDVDIDDDEVITIDESCAEDQRMKFRSAIEKNVAMAKIAKPVAIASSAEFRKKYTLNAAEIGSATNTFNA